MAGVIADRRGRVTGGTSDEILMAAYQTGNQDAFCELFDRYGGRVHAFLVRRLGDVAIADELHQEAFLRLHRARSSYDPERPCRAWLFAIVHNLVNDALRSRRRAPAMEPLSAVPGSTSDAEMNPDRGVTTETPEAIVATR